MSVGVIINPGTGPVVSARRSSAERNMRAFVLDAGADRFTRSGPSDEDGRYPFRLWNGKRSVTIDMPGCSLGRVRCTAQENPWLFHRLYVDGSSWLWDFAVRNACRALKLEIPAKWEWKGR